MIACVGNAKQYTPGPGQCFSYSRNGAVWTQQGVLPIPTGACLSGSGCSFAVSDDGNSAIVGDPSFNGSGAAWVYVRSGGVWGQPAPSLVAAGSVGTSVGFGSWVALSADGNTAIVGGPNDNGGAGAAWIFVRAVQPASVPPAPPR